MEKNILYQIKTLDKMILRVFMQERLDIKDFKLKIKPTRTQFTILSYLIEHCNEDIYQKDLEDILNLRRATVSGVLQTMEKNTLITRVTDSNDTRTKKIILSERAKEIFKKNKKKFEEIEKIIAVADTNSELADKFYNEIQKLKEMQCIFLGTGCQNKMKKYKEVIDKVNKLIAENSEKYWIDDEGEPKYLFNEIRDILSEVE